MGREEIRIVALGDELVSGMGDAKALGRRTSAGSASSSSPSRPRAPPT